MHDDYDRRTVLALGALGLAGFAGCLGGGSSGGATDGPGGSDTDGSGDGGRDDADGMDATAETGADGEGGGDGGDGTTVRPSSDTDPSGTGGPAQALDHPAATDLESQPRLGDLSASATIIAFEDPSCTRCRAFERNTVPKIESELVEAGTAAFVVRTYPVIYPWGGPAVQALEATFARDADAFWGLFDHYFAEQSAFTTDNVLARTREWLASNTDLDAEAVVADAETQAYDDAVQADLAAGREAGAGRTTPAVFLFRDGEYRTKAQGSVSFELIRNALGV